MKETVKIITEQENPLFQRKEVEATIENNVTPSTPEIVSILSQIYKVDEDAIKVKKINSEFGSRTFVLEANIYPSKEVKETVERKTKKEIEAEKKALEEQKKQEEEAKAKAEEEAKAEAPKETPPEEVAPKEEKPVEETPKEEPVQEEKKEAAVEEPKEEPKE